MTDRSFRTWLESQKKTVTAIARDFGVNRRTIYQWRDGHPVAPRNVQRVSEITGIPVERLIFREAIQ